MAELPLVADIAALSPESKLACFLDEASSVEFEFGRWDCVMMLANWVNVLTGIDTAADIRGTYHSIDQWKKLVNSEGGLWRCIDGRARKAGFFMKSVKKAELGNIALVQAAFDGSYVGCVRGHHRWWFKVGRGVTGVDMPPKVVWGLR